MASPKVKTEEGQAPVVIRAGMFGQIEPFVLGENVEEYLNRLEMFFLVNDTPEEKKVPVLITVAGPSLYTVLVKLCAPDDPKTKTCADLVTLLKTHLAPTTNVVAERYKFRKCEQLASQSITDFIINLKAMAQSCKYDAFLNDSLRDQFVAGINDQSLRKKLLTEADLTFDKACSIARSWEAAMSQNKEMSSQSSSPKIASFQKEGGRKQKPRSNQQGKEQKQSFSRPAQKSVKPCFRCGRHHDPNTCPAREWTCFTCGKQGHVSTSCLTKSRTPGPTKKSGRSNRVAEMSEAAEVLRLGLLIEVNESNVSARTRQQAFQEAVTCPSWSRGPTVVANNPHRR